MTRYYALQKDDRGRTYIGGELPSMPEDVFADETIRRESARLEASTSPEEIVTADELAQSAELREALAAWQRKDDSALAGYHRRLYAQGKRDEDHLSEDARAQMEFEATYEGRRLFSRRSHLSLLRQPKN